MKSRRILILAVALVAALFGGLITEEAPAQQQTYLVDGISFLPRSVDIGIDAWVVARVTILSAPSPIDALTATVSSPDPDQPANSLDVPPSFLATLQVGDSFRLAVQQVSLVPGNFGFFINSAVEGMVLPLTNFLAPDYDITMGLSMVTGEVGTQFLVTTTIDVGNMSQIQTRFDIEYVLDGVAQRQSEVVSLHGREFFVFTATGFDVVPFTQNPEYGTWHATQSFTPGPGDHTLVVNVLDQSIAQQVFSTSFTISVADQIQAVGTRLDELALEVGELDGRTENVELTASATAGSLTTVALVALGLSIVALLLQLGILKLRWFGRRGPREPEE